MQDILKKLPKTPTDWGAFIFLLFGIHSIALYELLVVLPFYKSLHPDLLYYTHVMAGVFIYVNTVTNLWKVMTTDTSTKGIMMPVILKPGWRFCTNCECNSPPRSFHCFVCRKCILKRDHHCNFTGNCVGYRNHRFYIMLVFYMCAAAIYSNVLNIDYIYHLFGEFSPKTVFIIILPMMAWMFGFMQSVSLGGALMTTLCLIGFLLTTGLSGYHLINISRGQIVHESAHNIKDYNLGLKNNIRSVMGTRWYVAWLCPFITSPLPGDGVEFPKKGSFENDKDM